MKIILDTDKRIITVPWNYQAKLEELNGIAKQYGGAGEDFQPQTFTGYIDAIWKECMANPDEQVKTAQRRAK